MAIAKSAHRSITLLRVACAVGLGLGGPGRTLSAQTITGQLLEAGTGRPIELGVVSLLTEAGDSVATVLSGRAGWFSLVSPTAGAFVVAASAWGFRDARVGVFDVGVDAELLIEFRVRPQPIELQELVVGLDQPIFEHRLVSNGFVDRFSEGFGRFITPVDIRRSPARSTSDLFRGIPGVTLRPPTASSSGTTGGGNVLSFLGEQVMIQGPSGWCTPSLFVDGVRVAYNGDVSLDALVPLGTVDGIEIYRRPAEVPVAYNSTRSPGAGDTPCGVVLLWSKTR